MSKAQHKRFLVSSGGNELVVKADSHEDACAAAVKQWASEHDAPELGLLCQSIEVSEDGVSYYSTEAACKRAGVWREETAIAKTQESP